MFLFRATHGKVLAGSSSFASQTTTAAGRHFVSNPIRSSERYELTATSATSLNQALLGARPRQVPTADGKGPCRQCSVPANVEVGRTAVLSWGGFVAPKSAPLVLRREVNV